ncbi:MAG: hypothetical protein H9855_02655 [Candidatus Acinetobacter avistercoris]|nr:hypothetical protein [Candidatus Acinetobacter avistercoris]
MTMTMFTGLGLVAISILALSLPNKLIDTSTCKRNWIAIFIILIGATFIIDEAQISLTLIAILVLGICINYGFEILLNVLKIFNWKSDP